VSNPLPDTYFLELAEKWRNQTITDDELRKLEQWYNQNQDETIEIPYSFASSEKELSERILYAIKQKAGIEAVESEPSDRVITIRKYWSPFFKYAAVVLILSCTILYFLNTKPSKTEVSQQNVEGVREDIVPLTEGAILTLSNGTQILLDSVKGKIANEGGISVINKDGSVVYDQYKNQQPKSEILYNTISTPKGKQYQLTLQDGSKVWLNAASSIRFPNAFTGKDRRVEITGEAYLEVAHNVAIPFIVSVDNMQVEVLGTRFDINSYNDDGYTKTTLIQGKVRTVSNGKIAVLKPGQQAQISQSSGEPIKIVEDVDLEEVMAWRDGIFRFKNSNIQSIMKQVERWYDVNVEYKVPTENLNFSGYVGKKEDVSQILKIMELTGLVHFKIEGRTIVVTK
jgi:hypothetical protein